MAKVKTILEEAQGLVMGPREQSYGTPKENWQDTADMMSGYLHSSGKLARDVQLSAHDAAMLMVMVKASREGKTPTRDNRVDIAGYALVADRIVNE